MIELSEQSAFRKRERWYVTILAAIQVIHILDFVIMMPLGPHFMRVFDISPSEFSILVSSYTFSAGIAGLFGALFADQYERKFFLLFNFSGFILGTFICGLSSDFPTLLIARIIAGAFGGILNANVLSMVSDLIPFQRRGSAMGIIMSAFSITSIFGIPIGLFIANSLSWNASFYFIAIMGILFWLLSFLILPSIKNKIEHKNLKEQFLNLALVISQKRYLTSFLLTCTLSFGLFIAIPFISPYMVRNVGMTETQLPLIYLIGGLFTIISARIIGKLCDQIGSFKVFKTVAIFSIFPLIVMTNLPQGTAIWLTLIFTTLFTMSGSGRFIPALTMISAVVNPKERGTFMNLENALRQIMSGIASVVGGLIIGSSSTGSLTNYGTVGLIGTLASVMAIFIALKIKNDNHLN
jgi:MFS transporter, DHA1 family, inner membrane transport protein